MNYIQTFVKSIPFIFVLFFFFFFFILSFPGSTFAANYYVSKLGNNQNGLSWNTAWNELDQINWSIIQPGDNIQIDGGPVQCGFPTLVTNSTNQPQPDNCGMIYNTTLTPQANGSETNPITIQTSNESGRNGSVRIFGGRSTPLGYCGQSGYALAPANPVGIYINGYSHIVIDGRHWSGIQVYGHNRHGVQLYHWGNQTDIVLRNMEIFDNGTFSGSNPDQAGINPNGTYIYFENLIIHDNGQDAIQTGYGNSIEFLTLRNSWLYNQRPHPTQTQEPFNYCTHTDGIQIYQYTGGKVLHGLTVSDSIIGPGFMQGFILGDYNSNGDWSSLQDVSITNTLLVNHHGSSSTTGILSKYNSSYVPTPPTNWFIDHVTIVRDSGQNWHNTYINGNGHTVTNSIFYGGIDLVVQGSPTNSNNYNYQVSDNSNIALEVNPQFADADYSGIGSGFADFDFTPTNPSIANAGSSIHTVSDLLDNSPQPTPTQTPTPVPSPTPTSTPTPTPTPIPGDANSDRKVDGVDYIIWLNHYNQLTNNGVSSGDFNLDGKVDGLDYVVWLINYGK